MIDINLLECLPNEVWKLHPINVAVSNLGRCYIPKNYNKQAHYTYGCDSNGYKLIKWKGKNYRLHRLIAECFIPNPNNYPTVDHINRNKSDNRVENLRWSTMSMQGENRDYSNYKNNANSKQVAQIDIKTNEIVRIWESTNECGRNGFDSGNVSKCCKNKYTPNYPNIYKGFIWKYVA